MQADVLRRAMESTRQDLKSLADDRRNHFLQIDNHLMSSHLRSKLPRLPEEILSRIFSMLYISETDVHWESQTIHRMLQDTEAPDEWKEIVRRGVPIVVANLADDEYDRYLDGIEHVVGSAPRLLSATNLDDIEDVTQTPVSVLIHTENWPSGEELQSLDRVRWNNLIVHYEAQDGQVQRDYILGLFPKARSPSQTNRCGVFGHMGGVQYVPPHGSAYPA